MLRGGDNVNKSMEVMLMEAIRNAGHGRSKSHARKGSGDRS